MLNTGVGHPGRSSSSLLGCGWPLTARLSSLLSPRFATPHTSTTNNSHCVKPNETIKLLKTNLAESHSPCRLLVFPALHALVLGLHPGILNCFSLFMDSSCCFVYISIQLAECNVAAPPPLYVRGTILKEDLLPPQKNIKAEK